MNEKQFNIVYLVGIIASTIIMLLILLTGVQSLHITFLIFFLIMKYLSGFGLVLSIANAFLIIMDKTKNSISKRGTMVLVVMQIVIPILLIVYGIYTIFSAYSKGTGGSQSVMMEWIQNIIYIYGIASLLLHLYIIPIAHQEFADAVELGKLGWWKKKAKNVGRGIKKKYFRLKKEYAKAQIQDQMTIKEILDLWRNKFAINLLLVAAIGAIVFTPIAFICVMYWLRLYIFFRSETKRYENVALLASMICLGIIAVISPLLNLAFYIAIEDWYWTVQIGYLIGIVLASFIFIKKILNMQGITITSLKMNSKDRQIEKLKKEREDLKKQLDTKKPKDNTEESKKEEPEEER